MESQSKQFTVVVTGARSWYHDGQRKVVRKRLKLLPANTRLIHGGCRGVDRLAASEAAKLGFLVQGFKADWDNLGLAAGPIRNGLMLDQKPDLVLAFHHNLTESKGTFDCVSQARLRGIPVEEIDGPRS